MIGEHEHFGGFCGHEETCVSRFEIYTKTLGN
jgi:hypothetical protein